MNSPRLYLSTAIPFVNARPHLGFALELVQADVLARQHRLAGDQVRFQTGTDDNSLKNVLAAQAEGIAVRTLVDRNSQAFRGLREPLGLSADDFIATSSDPRHLPGVERLWRACAASGDLYTKQYEGRYCVGCEQFYKPAELAAGRCPEHGTAPQLVAEENWFFRLSRYAGQLYDLVASGQLAIKPAARRNEVLGFISAGLEDFSVSRSNERARGWGISVPGDPGQVIYVWWDALGNYITAPGYGCDDAGYQRWWTEADRRIHLIGKGVLRFHAVYWPAILLSAGEPLPTDILVHDYLTIDGQKISKSNANSAAADPVKLAGAYGTDALRWWLLREVPRVGDTDFTIARLVTRANDDLAHGLGNLVNRVISLVHRYRQGRVPPPQAPSGPGPADGPGPATKGPGPAAGGPSPATRGPGPVTGGPGLAGGPGPVTGGAGPVTGGPECGRGEPAAAVPVGAQALAAACAQAAGRRAAALEAVDFRAATAAVWDIVEQANRYVEQVRPWELARAERDGDARAGQQLDAALRALIGACRALGRELAPFVPDLAARVTAACDDQGGCLGPARPLFPRIGDDGEVR
jgi:methionyl-tRNA synthetase